ncbi:MAG: tRNA pseudouridine(55) synthase TruB [Deltaproteobacteria bacterium]|nr:tRNA pseudouridine(55) synthase TruB [Deltaproteobacteria bacterium]
MVDGLLVVDKAEGPTSFDVVARARRALGTRSIGHTGTLDPLASGVLVLLAGNWTRLANVLVSDDKRYRATITFGAATSTDDRAGEVIARGDPATVDEERLAGALAGMLGVQRQVPPAFSAIHVEGERAYHKARRGEAVVLEAREVEIRALELVSWRAPDAVVDVHCSKGTYVRALARDLGRALGVPAHLSALRRTAAGPWTLDDAIPLTALEDAAAARAALRTGPAALRAVTLIPVDEATTAALRQGKRVPWSAPDTAAAVAHHGEQLVAIVAVEDGRLRVLRGFG